MRRNYEPMFFHPLLLLDVCKKRAKAVPHISQCGDFDHNHHTVIKVLRWTLFGFSVKLSLELCLQLARYKVPKYFVILDPSESFPLTVSGKVQKFKMREQSIKRLNLGDIPDVFQSTGWKYLTTRRILNKFYWYTLSFMDFLLYFLCLHSVKRVLRNWNKTMFNTVIGRMYTSNSRKPAICLYLDESFKMKSVSVKNCIFCSEDKQGTSSG